MNPEQSQPAPSCVDPRVFGITSRFGILRQHFSGPVSNLAGYGTRIAVRHRLEERDCLTDVVGRKTGPTRAHRQALLEHVDISTKQEFVRAVVIPLQEFAVACSYQLALTLERVANERVIGESAEQSACPEPVLEP